MLAPLLAVPFMAGTAADARAMAERYLILEAAAHPEERHRYRNMAIRSRKRAADIDAPATHSPKTGDLASS